MIKQISEDYFKVESFISDLQLNLKLGQMILQVVCLC